MCGIVGYVGNRDAVRIALECLKNLDYRGYDSSGIAFLEGSHVISVKSVGPVLALEEKLNGHTDSTSPFAICHTRWATHGKVTEENAHPHADCSGKIWLVHNGIIENYSELKEELFSRGHIFRSQTDTEVIAHLVEEEVGKMDFADAVKSALKKLKGSWAVLVHSSNEPNLLVAARNRSPLVIGLGEKEYLVASDASALLEHTNRFIYLENEDVAVLNGSIKIFDSRGSTVSREEKKITWSPELAKKGGWPHYMIKEIGEEPDVLENSISGRIRNGRAFFEELEPMKEKIREAERIIILACGTSFLAGKAAEYFFEEYLGISARAELASEFRSRNGALLKNDLAIFISQSGETADTLAALSIVKGKVPTIGIVNVMDSSLAREIDSVIYQRVGPEIGVASTKAFLSQVAILLLLTDYIGKIRGSEMKGFGDVPQELSKISKKIGKLFADREKIRELAEKYKDYNDFLYIGRKFGNPVAAEGALKLKEVSYKHSEAYAAGEMKHGPIALLDKNFPVLAIAPKDSVYKQMISSIEESRARNAPIIAILTEGDDKFSECENDLIFIPKAPEPLYPLLEIIPLQLFAYYSAIIAGHNPDKPRNLAKSVTVE